MPNAKCQEYNKSEYWNTPQYKELANCKKILIKTINDNKCEFYIKERFQKQYIEVCKMINELKNK